MANAPSTTDEVRAAAPGELTLLDETPPLRVSAARWRGYEVHAITLVVSVTILTLAALMSVHGQERVDLPFITQALPPLCHMKRMTGVDCPGCGLTRCFISIAHGDINRAWTFNPAGLLVFAMVVSQVPYRLYQMWRIRRGQGIWEHRRLTNVLVAIMVSAMLLQWFWKLLGMPFAWNE